jgi:hypothetical protein
VDSPDIPAPPDPKVVAEAQTKSNKETAIANAYLNRVDQTNPFGTSSWTVTGTNPDGTPKFSQSQTFSQPVQGLFDSSMAMSKGLADTGVSQLQQLQQQYSRPFSLDTETENKMNQLRSLRLEPSLAQQEDALRTRLTNQGIREGTPAWDRALTRQGEIANDARNSLWINSRQQGVNEALLQRQQPLAEFNAIRTGTMPQMPQFGAVPNVQQATTDIAGITQNAYNQQLAAAQMESQQQNAFMGGLFGMAGTLGGAYLRSDIRLKRDIERIGSLPSGLPVYRYRYLWSDEPQVGVMAHEARELFPDAVAEFDGFLAVDYARIG